MVRDTILLDLTEALHYFIDMDQSLFDRDTLSRKRQFSR